MKKEKLYTREIHIDRLRKMLKRKKPCSCCPRGYRYTMYNDGPWDNSGEACDICLDFIGLGEFKGNVTCPCYELGEEEALKRTYLALEKED